MPMGAAATGGELIEVVVADNAERRLAAGDLARCPDQAAISRLDRIAVPTLVVHGDQEHPAIVAIAERLVADIPDARLEVVPGADYYLPLRVLDRLV
ncbi:alpha/beta fold hydrolase [Saccharopolyspora shandongensis]|uniref:alpha/beta fold hydrolase n=1 Tax=Saccharopolyspora shandongensis TaxID=418495 RepID=UPI0034026556